jgi:PIN like domain
MVPEHFSNRGCHVEKHDDHFLPDTKDPDLLAVVAEEGWAFITQDTRIRRRPAERQALLESGIRAFALVSTANLSATETIEVLERAEVEVKRALSGSVGPSLYGIRKDGSLTKIDLT